LHATNRDGNIVTHDLRARHRQRLALRRVHLACKTRASAHTQVISTGAQKTRIDAERAAVCDTIEFTLCLKHVRALKGLAASVQCQRGLSNTLAASQGYLASVTEAIQTKDQQGESCGPWQTMPEDVHK
jgi:hypothetical protein